MGGEITALLESLTIWHWLGFAVILLGIEMLTGTYDLLWISLAAFLTGLVQLLPFPAELSGWPWQLGTFGLFAIGFVALGRTAFRSMRQPKTDRPLLNQRTQALVGKTGQAVRGFETGMGRIKIGDTEWSAEADSPDLHIAEGMKVVVSAADGTVLKVRPFA